MSYDSIIKGLDEAIKINKGELAGRKQKTSIPPVSEYSKE
jgi:hypothetical protein